MQALDYSRLVGETNADRTAPRGALVTENAYLRRDGVRFVSRLQARQFVHDRVRLTDDAFLFSTEYSCRDASAHEETASEPDQIVSDTDWVHIQFRIAAGGSEQVSGGTVIHTPEGACTVTRYPADSLIRRYGPQARHRKLACLFFRPRELGGILDTAPAGLPPSLSWLGPDDRVELHTMSLPLQPAMLVAVNDILSCAYNGISRRAFMRAKALELISCLFAALDGASADDSVARLSQSDLQKAARARDVMMENLGQNWTLAEIAGAVGFNRAKLALAFRACYGMSVQSFWRDARLAHARVLLGQGTRVTEVALSLGYAEVSSFSRAFTRRFGVPPRDCMRS